MKQLLRGAMTAVISGGAASTALVVMAPEHFDFKHVGSIFLAGSVIGLLNWLRTSPWDTKVVNAAQDVADEKAVAKAAGE